MYLVKTKNKSDNQFTDGFVDTYEAETKSEAIQIAVLKYLDNFADTGEVGQRFLEIYKSYNRGTIGMAKELFRFFQQNESSVFAGEHVDKTFSIVLELKEEDEVQRNKT